MTVNYEEIFGEDVDLDEVLSMVRFEDYKGATNVKDELNYNSGWYNYSTVTFDYEGKRYSVEYKEHTSDNVSDMEYLYDTFCCLGEVSEMDEMITKEDLARVTSTYKMQLEKQLKEINDYKGLLSTLNPLSKKQLKDAGEMLIKVEEESNDKRGEKSPLDLGAIGEFLVKLSKTKKR